MKTRTLVLTIIALAAGLTLAGSKSKRPDSSVAGAEPADPVPEARTPLVRERARLPELPRGAPEDEQGDAAARANAVSEDVAPDGAAGAFAAPVSPDARRELVRDRQRRFAAYLDERMRGEARDPDRERSVTAEVHAALRMLPFANELRWEVDRCTENMCRASVGFASPDVQARREGLLRAISHFTGGEVFVHRENDTDEPKSIVYFTPEGTKLPWALLGGRG
jgi:hypothetical protein